MYDLTVSSTYILNVIYIMTVTMYTMIATQEIMEFTVEDDQMCFSCAVDGEDICLPWILRCDGERHCDRNADEVFPTCYGDSCVTLLPDFRRCDGNKDCRDGRDEYYDGCHDQEADISVSVFKDTTVAVTAMFLLSVAVILLGFIFCICCCCRRGREGRPYISDIVDDNEDKKDTADGRRWVSQVAGNYSMGGNFVYDLSENSV